MTSSQPTGKPWYVRLWPLAAALTLRRRVRYWGNSCRASATVGAAANDPKRTLGCADLTTSGVPVWPVTMPASS